MPSCLVPLLIISALFAPSLSAVCPSGCDCPEPEIADCSGLGLHFIPRDIGPNIEFLDLSRNKIKAVHSDTFLKTKAKNLSMLILDYNEIEEIQPHAFKGLENLNVLSLRGNKLTRIVPYAFTGISGHISCKEDCLVDLSDNDLQEVQKNALAWVKRLSVFIGKSRTDLVLKAYSFYGISDVKIIRIFDVPSLTVEPRAFTNAENVATVQIFNSRLPKVKAFTFEGISDLKVLNISGCEISEIEPFGFSGIQYSSEVSSSSVNVNNSVSTGGVFNIESCSLYEIPQHAFKDTNLVSVIIKRNSIMRIGPFAFQGLLNLETVHIIGNNMPRLTSNSLSSLNNLKEIIIHNNDIATIEKNAFYETQEINLISIGNNPAVNMSISQNAFSHLYDVNHLEIQGLAYLEVEPLAFDDMVSVGLLEIKDSRIPEVHPETFTGFSKIRTLRMTNCNVSVVHTKAFGQSISLGTVDLFDISTGNNLPCDCQTSNMLHDFESFFGAYKVTCQGGNASPYHVRARDLPRCSASAISSVAFFLLLTILCVIHNL